MIHIVSHGWTNTFHGGMTMAEGGLDWITDTLQECR